MPGLAHFFKNASFWSASVVPYSYTIKYLVTLSDYIKHGIRPRTSTSPPFSQISNPCVFRIVVFKVEIKSTFLTF